MILDATCGAKYIYKGLHTQFSPDEIQFMDVRHGTYIYEGKEHNYYLIIPEMKTLISTDGKGSWTNGDEELERLTDAIYKDGHDFERTEWLPNNCDFSKLDMRGARKMRDIVLEYI